MLEGFGFYKNDQDERGTMYIHIVYDENIIVPKLKERQEQGQEQEQEQEQEQGQEQGQEKVVEKELSSVITAYSMIQFKNLLL